MMMRRNVILIGFMGCGKTTVGQLLAVLLGYAFADTDALVEEAAAMRIPEIFEKYGEGYFRQLEKQAIAKVCTMRETVVATGGGVVQDADNAAVLLSSGCVVYLKASAEKVYINIKGGEGRPLLSTENPLAAIRALMAKREPLYHQNCHFAPDVEALTAEETARVIVDLIEVNQYLLE
jgi:shikimate kinase